MSPATQRALFWFLLGVGVSALAIYRASFFPECIGVFFSGANFALADMARKPGPK